MFHKVKDMVPAYINGPMFHNRNVLSSQITIIIPTKNKNTKIIPTLILQSKTTEMVIID